MKGFYHCNSCNVYVRVNSLSRRSGSDSFVRPSIKHCPHCLGNDLKEISEYKFLNINHSISISVSRKYSFQKVGERCLCLTLKWM